MKATDKITSFVNEYNTKLQDMDKKLTDASARKDEIQLELVYLKQKEIPEAIERRILTGEATLENRLKKNQAKLQDELQAMEETILVLTNAINRYKIDSASQITELEKAVFRHEKLMLEAEIYDKLSKADKNHRKHLASIAKPLHDYNSVQSQIEAVKREGGMRASYPELEIPSQHMKKLEITRNDLVEIIKRLKAE